MTSRIAPQPKDNADLRNPLAERGYHRTVHEGGYRGTAYQYQLDAPQGTVRVVHYPDDGDAVDVHLLHGPSILDWTSAFTSCPPVDAVLAVAAVAEAAAR